MFNFRRYIPLIIFVFLSGLTQSVWSAPVFTVTPEYVAYEEALAGVRLRSFNNTGGSELYLGVPDLGVGTQRSELNIRWAASNDLAFTFDRAADSLNVTVVNDNGTYSLDYANVSAQMAALGKTYTVDDLNVLHITLADRDEGSVLLQNLVVNGEALGDFSGDGWLDWMVTGGSFSEGIELTATLLLSGSFSSSQEKSKVEFKLGYQVVPDTTPPMTSINESTLEAKVVAPQQATAVFHFTGSDDTTSPENLAFECSLNNGDWSLCTSPAIFDGLADGSYTFAVRAIDEAANVDLNPPTRQWQVDTVYHLYLPVVVR